MGYLKDRRRKVKRLERSLRSYKTAIASLNTQIDSLASQVRHAAKVTGEWAGEKKTEERNRILENARTARMIEQFVAHLKDRNDPESRHALARIDADARTFNPIFKSIGQLPANQPALQL